jgi:hypothetical protein
MRVLLSCDCCGLTAAQAICHLHLAFRRAWWEIFEHLGYGFVQVLLIFVGFI